MRKINFTEKEASFLLAAVIIARATSYLFSQNCLSYVGPLALLGVRSLAASALLLPLVWKKLPGLTKNDLKAGAVLGFLFFITMVCELFSLKTIASSVGSILENTAIVMVPLLTAALTRRLPEPKTLLCCLLALIGVLCMTYEGGAFHFAVGEGMMLLAAFFYAVTIITTAKLSRASDPILVGFLQVAVTGTLAIAAALLVEQPTLPAAPSFWLPLGYLAVVCTCFGFTLQPLAQSKCSAEKAAVFCALNPLTATTLGVVVKGEPFGLLDALGLVLVLGAIVLYGRRSAGGAKK